MLNSLRAQHIELKTEGTTFYIGEAVKGYLILTANKSFKIHDASISMYGKEKTNIGGTMAGPFPASSDPWTSNVWKAVDTFMAWDVPPKELFSAIGAKQVDLYTLEVPAGIKQFPFEFLLPEEGIPESYKGKCVQITYTIEAKVDIRNSIGFRNRQEIAVVRPSKDNGNQQQYTPDDLDKGVNGESPSNIGIPADKADKTSTLVLKNDTIRLQLYKKIFLRGERIKGNVVLAKITQPEKIRKVEITLSGIEFATVNTDLYVANSMRWGLTEQQNKMEGYTKEIEVPKIKGDIIIIPFEFQIPKQVKRSYTGKYSKFYWLVEAKIDMKRMVDSHTDEEITII